MKSNNIFDVLAYINITIIFTKFKGLRKHLIYSPELPACIPPTPPIPPIIPPPGAVLAPILPPGFAPRCPAEV